MKTYEEKITRIENLHTIIKRTHRGLDNKTIHGPKTVKKAKDRVDEAIAELKVLSRETGIKIEKYDFSDEPCNPNHLAVSKTYHDKRDRVAKILNFAQGLLADHYPAGTAPTWEMVGTVEGVEAKLREVIFALGSAGPLGMTDEEEAPQFIEINIESGREYSTVSENWYTPTKI